MASPARTAPSRRIFQPTRTLPFYLAILKMRLNFRADHFPETVIFPLKTSGHSSLSVGEKGWDEEEQPNSNFASSLASSIFK
jgi:hypothetical protein